MKSLCLLALSLLLCNCSTLPKPGGTSAIPSEKADAASILAGSAKATGNPWRRYGTVEVKYAGEWTNAAAKIQPVIVDREFRKESVETFSTQSGIVKQIHSGPGGTKLVRSSDSKTEVSYNDRADGDPEKLSAAAMVADAYTMFTFGSSWLHTEGKDLEIVGREEFDGEECILIQGRVSPGFGMSENDWFIAWIGRESKLMRRVQFTIEGVESTRGADVSVDFSQFKTAADGSIWPTHFIENVERPIHIKAHEWKTLSVVADGRKLLSE